MNSLPLNPREITPVTVLAAIVIAVIFILVMSLLKEPHRKKVNAIILGGAGGVYWSGGLGVWEFLFGTLLLCVAYKGLNSYTFIGIGWLLHTIWDLVHHFYGEPIVFLEPSSSAGCAICDPIIAVWFFFGAPNVLQFFRKGNTAPV